MNTEAAKYFKLNLQGQSPRQIIHRIGEVDLRKINLDMAERLWKQNFQYIELTEAGILKYLGSTNETGKPRYGIFEVIKLIKTSVCPDDARYFGRLYPDNTRIRAELTKRLNQLKGGTI